MPLNPLVKSKWIIDVLIPFSQNALALKTAALSSTKSLYQTCSALRRRLRCVEDFAPFLGLFILHQTPYIVVNSSLTEQPADIEPLDVVSHILHVLRLGSPLCHLYNLLIPAFLHPSSPLYANAPVPKQIEYDFPMFLDSIDGVRNWAKRPENAKTCQKYIAVFCMAMRQRQLEGRWQGEIWALHELWGKSTGDDIEAYDSSGLMKVLHTVESMLDALPESAMTPLSPITPYTASSQHFSARHQSRQSFDVPFSIGGTGPGATAVTNMVANINGGVHIEAQVFSPIAEDMSRGMSRSSADANAFKSVAELVSSEKSYVQELEILVRCSAELLAAHLVSTETNHQIFSNLSKILDFHVREIEYT